MEPQRTRSAQAQFGANAASYVTSAVHMGDESMELLVDLVVSGGRRYDTAVDVGTGIGFTAFAVAPYARRVVATDITPQMLSEASRVRNERRLGGVLLALAAAEALPFADGVVDLVTTRAAAHHFVDVRLWLAEASRVLAPGGHLVLADTVSPEDRAAAEWMHGIELRRDPSHARNLSVAEWQEAVRAVGLRVTDVRLTRVHLEYGDWARRAGLSAEASAGLRAEFAAAPASVRAAFGVASGAAGEVRFFWPMVVLGAAKPPEA